ncbi:MAG: penicillin-insensitive murein endopeptidase [Kofleriaceae bacterium]
MRVFAVVCVLLAMTFTTTTVEARGKRAKKHSVEKRKKTEAAATRAQREGEAPKKKKSDRSIGAPWSGSLQAAAKLRPGERYYLRRPWRAYATRTTVDFVRQAVKDTLQSYPKVHSLAIGDFSQESGGKITEHASHQSGRDVDIGLFYKKKPKGYPDAFVKATKDTLDAAATWRLVSLLARTNDEDGGVQIIFLDQKLQNALLTWAEKHRIPEKRIKEVRKVFRHIPLHSDHMHVRFKCRERDTSCR